VKQLVLVGGGHAHVEIVRRFGLSPVPGVGLTVVDPNPRPVYSGMVPGFVAGEYRRDELEIDLPSLCRSAGAALVQSPATTIEAREGVVHCANGEALAYELASVDVGSTVSGTDLPGVRAHALASRPIPKLVASIAGLIEEAKSRSPERFAVLVVGGGAGGVELAFCLEARLRREGANPEVAILTANGRLLAGASIALSRAVTRAAAVRGIKWVPDALVSELDGSSVRLADGDTLPADAVLWVTGPAAHSLAADSKLPIDAQGFIETTDTLRVAGHENLFAVGDCASLAGMKRAGVYAVRSAPLLDHNLRACLSGGRLKSYRPQRDFLSLLNLGDGTAIGAKWGITIGGRTVLRVKDRIDRSFMEKYR
jgi:selenide,water dikinase